MSVADIPSVGFVLRLFVGCRLFFSGGFACSVRKKIPARPRFPLARLAAPASYPVAIATLFIYGASLSEADLLSRNAGFIAAD